MEKTITGLGPLNNQPALHFLYGEFLMVYIPCAGGFRNYTVTYIVFKQRKSRSACTDMWADQDIRCLYVRVLNTLI